MERIAEFDRASLPDVRAAIASAYLGASGSVAALGAIRLKPHQVEAVQRLRSAIAEFGGAMLCDPVGTGKTFVALALARSYGRTLVVGPAVLRPMWKHASAAAEVDTAFISHEALSRRAMDVLAFDFIIVDEAHHARNTRSRRFAELSRIASCLPVLLLSATPIHNRRRDVTSLLSVFLGEQASALTNAELGRCIVRREAALSPERIGMPAIQPIQWLHLPDGGCVVEQLLALPPPLPPRDGGDGGILIAHSLVRQWASSDAALKGGLTRRRQRALALISALESGTYPSISELAAWTVADDSVQLAFADLVAPRTPDTVELLSSARMHLDAVVALLARLTSDSRIDEVRASLIREVRSRHQRMPIVAFSQYEDTVAAMYTRLARDGGVAALTGTGGRVAGGRISRSDTISRFAPGATGHPQPSKAETISLLLTTDLLSEGVNLQDAGVVIHLDLPWTPARMEQRLGRIARIGSPHAFVTSYAIHPPASAEAVARLERILERKMRAAGILVGGFPSLTVSGVLSDERNEPRLVEELRDRLTTWLNEHSTPTRGVLACAVAADTPGFLAVCRDSQRIVLLGSLDDHIGDDPLTLTRCARISELSPIAVDEIAVRRAISSLESHLLASRALNGIRPEVNTALRLRQAILRRARHAVRSARPHERMGIVSSAAIVRVELQSRIGVHIERELSRLLTLDTPDDTWLESVIACLRDVPHRTEMESGARPEVMAIILFDVRDHANGLSSATER